MVLQFTWELASSVVNTDGQLGVFLFSSSVHILIELKDGDRLIAENIKRTILNAPHLRGDTAIYLALLEAINQFKHLAVRRCKPQKLLIITDGGSTSPRDAVTAAANLRAADVELYVLGVGKKINKPHLLELTGNETGKLFHAADFSKLVALLPEVSDKLIPS